MKDRINYISKLIIREGRTAKLQNQLRPAAKIENGCSNFPKQLMNDDSETKENDTELRQHSSQKAQLVGVLGYLELLRLAGLDGMFLMSSTGDFAIYNIVLRVIASRTIQTMFVNRERAAQLDGCSEGGILFFVPCLLEELQQSIRNSPSKWPRASDNMPLGLDLDLIFALSNDTAGSVWYPNLLKKCRQLVFPFATTSALALHLKALESVIYDALYHSPRFPQLQCLAKPMSHLNHSAGMSLRDERQGPNSNLADECNLLSSSCV